MSNNKYNATGVYYNLEKRKTLTEGEIYYYRKLNCYQREKRHEIVFFASKFEFKVFQALSEIFGHDNILPQHHVPIIFPGKCYPFGKEWAIDFAIKPARSRTTGLFVEAKGMCTQNFLHNLAMLEANNPRVFEKLVIVFDTSIPIKHSIIANLRKYNELGGCQVLLYSEFIQKYSQQMVTA